MSYDDLSLSIRLCTGENAHSIQMMNPALFPGRAHIGFSFLSSSALVLAAPVICESPMVPLIIHDRPCHEPAAFRAEI